MKKLDSAGIIVRVSIAFILFTVFGVIFCGLSYASEKPQSGSRYNIVRPLYLIGVYKNLNDRKLNRDKAYAYLSSEENAKRAWMAFQREVPTGTIMTIIGPAPKAKTWHFPFFFKRYSVYLVRLDPDLSRGLDIILELSLGIEGNLDGLNPEIFSRNHEIRGHDTNKAKNKRGLLQKGKGDRHVYR